MDSRTRTKVAIKKLYRPFQSELFAKRAYRELRLLKHMKHENVSHVSDPQDCIFIFFFIIKNEGQKMISTCSVSLCRWSACWTCSLPTSLWTNSRTCECRVLLCHINWTFTLNSTQCQSWASFPPRDVFLLVPKLPGDAVHGDGPGEGAEAAAAVRRKDPVFGLSDAPRSKGGGLYSGRTLSTAC